MTREKARVARDVIDAMRGHWIATGTLLTDPYPCVCHRSQGCKTGHGRRCPCWGAPIHDGLPVACCARKPKHPNLLET